VPSRVKPKYSGRHDNNLSLGHRRQIIIGKTCKKTKEQLRRKLEKRITWDLLARGQRKELSVEKTRGFTAKRAHGVPEARNSS